MRKEGVLVSNAHLRYIVPFQKNLDAVLSRFKTILIPEINTGQLRTILTSHFHHNYVGLNKVQGKPFKIREIRAKIEQLLGKNT
jgi:2-oxoglutarate ferredoxin oxidoreductase subunit alpha